MDGIRGQIVRGLLLLVVTGVLGLLAEPARALPTGLTPVILFDVTDVGSGRQLYTGRETIRLTGGDLEKKTWYYDAGGKTVQTEEVRFDPGNLVTRYYRLDNSLTGERALVEFADGRVRVGWRATAKEPFEKKSLVWQKDTILGKSLHNLIMQNRGRLSGDQPVEFSLLVPFRQELIDFRVSVAARGKDTVVYRLEPASWIVRQLVDSMDFTYQAGPPYRLLTYQGPTTINTRAGDDRQIRIRFRYENGSGSGGIRPAGGAPVPGR